MLKKPPADSNLLSRSELNCPNLQTGEDSPGIPNLLHLRDPAEEAFYSLRLGLGEAIIEHNLRIKKW
jgi:hypothetical protein